MLKKLCVTTGTAVVITGIALGASLTAPDDKPNHSIKEIMQEAHKGGLLKKVSEGDPTQADKERLLSLYIDLWSNDPPMGEKGSWKEKSGAAVVAAARAVLKQEGAGKQLKDAVNCGACHKAHKKG